jgi:phosphate-selective porin OprO/OprP
LSIWLNSAGFPGSRALLLFAVTIALCAPGEPAGAEETEPDDPAVEEQSETDLGVYGSFKSKWDNLVEAIIDFTSFDLKNGMFRFQIGLRMQLDGTLVFEDDQLIAAVGKPDDSFDARRVRIFAEGLLFRYTNFKFEYDFAADQGLKDAYIDTLGRVEHIQLRLGHFKEPFSLERHTSANDLGFLEWSLPVATIAPGRNIGAMFHSPAARNRMTWAAGVFTTGKLTDDNRSDSDLTFTGRLTGLPVDAREGRRLVHLGASYSLRDPAGGTVQYASRPEARFVDFFIDTGSFESDKAKLLALEAAGVGGPFWWQAEWVGADNSSESFGDPRFSGYYAQVGYFLSGESRPYDRGAGAWHRVMPLNDFHRGNPFRKGSPGGAMEFTGRYSTMDLNDAGITGGELRDLSFGINWYLTGATRFMFNFVHSDIVDGGRANIFLLRYQFNPGLRSPYPPPPPPKHYFHFP